jgi:hypothetical protein
MSRIKKEILNKLKEYAGKMGRDHLGGDDYTSKKKGGLRDFDGYDNVDYNKDMPMDEASRGTIHKAAKKGSYPVSLVVVKDGKVINQVLNIKTPAEVPAAFNVVKNYHKHKGATVHIEDRTGKRLFSESVNEDSPESSHPQGSKKLTNRTTVMDMLDVISHKEFGPDYHKLSTKQKKEVHKLAIKGKLIKQSPFKESVNEAKVETERYFGKKGIIIMIRDGNKMISAIFKDKKNADKFNRNNPADVKKLLQLAKKTKYPKAIDESVNEAKVNYNFSADELKRVLKLLGRNASTEVKMIKAFEKAFGRKLTRDELFESINEVGVNVWYIYKKANKNKNKFFNMLSDFRKKHSDTAWIKMLNYALEDFNENPKKYKTIDDKQNILFKNLQNNKKVYEGMFSTIDQIRQDSKDVRDFVKNVFKDKEFKKMSNDKDFIKYLKSIYEGVSENSGISNWMSGRTSDYHTALRGKNRDYSGGTNFKKKNHGQPDIENDDEDQETNHLSNKQTHVKSDKLKVSESGKKKSDKNYKDWKSTNEGFDKIEHLSLLNKALRAIPGSPKQKDIIRKLNKVRKAGGMRPLKELSIVEYGQRLDLSFLEDEEARLKGTPSSKDAINRDIDETAKRDYKDEYKKFQSSKKSKKYRAELNKYNRQKGTYGNGDGKDASHKGGKIVGFESASKNRGRKEKSRLKKK